LALHSCSRSSPTVGGRHYIFTSKDVRLLLAGGTFNSVEVLKPETVKLMARNAIGDLNVLEVETFPGQVKKWGLTFLINTEDVQGFRSAGSLTWGGVHNTYFWIDLKKRVTAVALMQILPIGDPHVQETMIAFERTLYAAISSIA
jgi:methyl acetate hydrolase